MESLEGRSLMAADVTPSLAAALVDDTFEQNDTLSGARKLGTLTAPRTIANLVMADANDWFRFTLATKPLANESISIGLQNAQGDLDLSLYNNLGQRVRLSNSTNNSERVWLNGLNAGSYYVRVNGYLGATNPNYSLSFNLAQQSGDDTYENNDTRGAARNLGTLSSVRTISNLVMADGHDWYRFTMNAAGTSADYVLASFQNAQGNLNLELYNASGTRLAMSSTAANSERISLAGRAAGTYYVHVLGASNPNYSLRIDPGTASSPPSSGGFNIQLRFSGLPASQQSIFEQAAAKWESIITGDLPNATYGGVAVDDLLIDARGVAIDGAGNILGQAGPDALRSSSRLPYHGTMEFDTADLSSMQANGTLLGVIAHEMGHVLGLGTLWASKGLVVGAGTSNPRYIGTQGVAAYSGLIGSSASGVPLENTGGAGTRDSHWRESVFSTELMTGWVGPGSNMPISRVTVGALADLGYTVNYAAADPFTVSGASAVAPVSGTTGGGTTGNIFRTDDMPTTTLDSIHDRWLASWSGRAGRAEAASPFNVPSGRGHEAATDAVLADWLMLAGLV